MADVKGISNSVYSNTYTSFSGIDITASILVKDVFSDKPNSTNLVVLASIQAVSYSITREKAPIYTMGDPDPRSFSRGKRGIAGSLIFVLFDRHAIYSVLKNTRYLAHVGSLSEPNFKPDERGKNTPKDLDVRVATPIYADQIPAFDLTLTGANEYGQVAQMKILGCEILNEGNSLSVDDIVNESQMTFVARKIINWVPIVKEQSVEDINAGIEAGANSGRPFGIRQDLDNPQNPTLETVSVGGVSPDAVDKDTLTPVSLR